MELSNSNKLNELIKPKIKYLTTFLDNNVKRAIYTGGDICGIYFYLEIIVSPTNLTSSGQSSSPFGT